MEKPRKAFQEPFFHEPLLPIENPRRKYKFRYTVKEDITDDMPSQPKPYV